jgi:SOS-response transcriptional repressor LexA
MNNGNGHKYIYLSEPKLKTLKFIKNYIKKHNFSPTFAEISQAMKWSRARSGKIVSELYDLGFISKGISSHRKIEMTTEQMGSVANLNINKSYPVIESQA